MLVEVSPTPRLLYAQLKLETSTALADNSECSDMVLTGHHESLEGRDRESNVFLCSVKLTCLRTTFLHDAF